MAEYRYVQTRSRKGVMDSKLLVAFISVVVAILIAIPTTYMYALADTKADTAAANTETTALAAPASDVAAKADTAAEKAADTAAGTAATADDKAAEATSATADAKAETATNDAKAETANTAAAEKDVTTDVRVVLAEGTLADGQKSIQAKLEKKTKSGWDKVGDMGLTESAKLEIAGLGEGTYRVVISDTAEDREIEDTLTLTNGTAKTKFKSEDGIYLDETTDGALITVSLEEKKSAAETNTEDNSNAPNEGKAENTSGKNPVPDTVDPNDESTWKSAEDSYVEPFEESPIDNEAKAGIDTSLGLLGYESASTALLAGATSTLSASAGDPPSSFSGSCYISSYYTQGSYTSFTVGSFTGVPSGYRVTGAHCISPGLAEGTGASYYTATLSSVDKAAGKAYYSLFIAAPWSGSQNVGATLVLDWEFEVHVKVKKVSADPALTEGNACYSFANAHFIVYKNWSWNQEDKPIDEICLLTADASGNTNESFPLEPGWYYIRETDAPMGYKLDENTYPIEVRAGTGVVTIADEPGNDPAAMFAGKIDAETMTSMPQGSASLAGAEFTIDWYGGWFGQDGDGAAAYADVKGQADAHLATVGGIDHRTWVVKTNEKGYAEISDSFKVSGDPLFYDSAGQAILPAGTFVIKETKAPEGYLLNEDAQYARHIDLDGSTYGAPVAYNVPTVKEQVMRNGISVSKTVNGGTAELTGIGFYVTDKDGNRMSWTDEDGHETDEIYLDSKGHAETTKDALAYGTYQLHEDERTLPEGFILPEDDVVATFTIDENYDTHDIYNIDVVNNKAPELKVIKVDGDSLKDNNMKEELADRVEGAKFELAYVSGTEATVLATLETDANGEIDFTSYVKHYGTYRLTEVAPADADDTENGYMTPEGAWQKAEFEFTVDAGMYEAAKTGAYEGSAGDSFATSVRDDDTVVFTRTVANWRYRTIEADKVDQDDGSPVAGTTFQFYKYTGEGIPEECVHLDRADDHGEYVSDPTEGIDADKWELVSEGTTDSNGAFIMDGLEFGGYMVVEAVPAPTYAAWYESAGSTWDRYYFAVDEDSGQKQTQVFRNEKINIECNVDKSTIDVTSAAFNSLDGQVVNFQNVETELYRYDVAFDNGATNVVSDQYTVIDTMGFNEEGVRLDHLWTPITVGDYDGTYTIWYQTNTMATGSGSGSDAKAGNPDNAMTDGTDRIKTDGWYVWAANVSATSRTELTVEDLGLAEGEYVSGLMLEYGAVEPGFATTTPLQYMVYASQELEVGTVIRNTAESHITRNWMSADSKHDNEWGLYDDATDSVETRVIDTFSYDTSTGRYYNSNWGGSGIGKTGDMLGSVVSTLAMVAMAAFALLALAMAIGRLRREEK